MDIDRRVKGLEIALQIVCLLLGALIGAVGSLAWAVYKIIGALW